MVSCFPLHLVLTGHKKEKAAAAAVAAAATAKETEKKVAQPENAEAEQEEKEQAENEQAESDNAENEHMEQDQQKEPQNEATASANEDEKKDQVGRITGNFCLYFPKVINEHFKVAMSHSLGCLFKI